MRRENEMFIYEENQFNSIYLNIHETYMHGKYCINIEADNTPICSKVISQRKQRKNIQVMWPIEN